MERWVIEGSDRSPAVLMDRKDSVLRIEGRSYPDDGMDFFAPILLRFRSLAVTDDPIGTVHLRLEYYNSTTMAALAELFTSMKQISERGFSVKLIWEFEQDDDEVAEDIQMFRETFDLDLETRPTTFNRSAPPNG